MEQAEKLVRYFKDNEELLAQIDVSGLRDVAGVASLVLEEKGGAVDLKIDAYGLICKAAMNRRLPLEERWSMYWLLSTKMFVSVDYDQYEEALDNLYADIYLDIKQQLSEDLLTGSVEVKPNGPIVIVTSQFLSLGHAPTRRVLDYAYSLNRILGIPVTIINESGMHIHRPSYLSGAVSFNFVENYSKRKKFSYKDATFDFFQVDSLMPDLQEIANIIYNIKKMAPRLVLNVGAACLTSDLCREFAKTATIPCSTAIPRTMAEYPVVCRNLRETDNAKLGRLQPYQHIVESVFNYIMPDDRNLTKYTRDMFGIPDDAWLLVSAGNRMAQELDADFMRMVDGVLGEIPDGHFLIIGEVNEQSRARLTAGLQHTDRIHFAGSCKDGSQAVRLGNVYIQPTRKGGGRAAFEGLYYGVPVITTKYGDTWDVCGEIFEAESYEEMAEKIKVLYSDRELYGEYRKASKQRADILEDMGGMFKALLQKLEVDLDGNASCVDESKFYDIFNPGKEEIILERLSDSMAELNRMMLVQMKLLRDNEWATVLRDTVVGSEWLKDVPLSPGRCAIGYPGLYALYRTLDEFRPKNILEIGLGQSTRVIGAYAGQYGVRHTIVEHDSSWINFFLNKHGKNENTEMVCLERLEGQYHGRWVNTKTPIKYYKDFSSAFVGQKFDFIFIDGPQGSNEFSRVDITEILPECLTESFVIMVDDSQRQGERNTIKIIADILTSTGVGGLWGEYDGLKNTALIVSEDLRFLLSL